MKKINEQGKVENLTIWNFPKLEKPSMTSLQGNVNIAYKDIVNTFGEETLNGDGYKVQAEWHLITPDGFATIYDYKEGKQYLGDEGISKTKVTDWHIGGERQEVVKWVLKSLNCK